LGRDFPLDDLLELSVVLNNLLEPTVRLRPAAADDRGDTSMGLARVAFEHAGAVLILLQHSRFTTAMGLLRLQYESFVRSLWAHYCATDAAIDKLRSRERLTSNERLVTMSEMVRQLEECVPPPLAASLREFQDSAYRLLNSYVHAGAHTLFWKSTGQPAVLIEVNLRFSNGLSVFTCMHMAEVAQDMDRMLAVATTGADPRFERIMPLMRPKGAV